MGINMGMPKIVGLIWILLEYDCFSELKTAQMEPDVWQISQLRRLQPIILCLLLYAYANGGMSLSFQKYTPDLTAKIRSCSYCFSQREAHIWRILHL